MSQNYRHTWTWFIAKLSSMTQCFMSLGKKYAIWLMTCLIGFRLLRVVGMKRKKPLHLFLRKCVSFMSVLIPLLMTWRRG